MEPTFFLYVKFKVYTMALWEPGGSPRAFHCRTTGDSSAAHLR